ncbi:MAG: ABC transporter permease [Candidatus Woesearchaeota archaeon]
MGTILKVIKKNIKLLIRSKGSALIVIFGPLLVIFLVGIAFDNSNAYMVKIGAYSEKFSDFSNSIVNQLNDKDFRVSIFSSKEACIEAIKQGEVHVCMFFSKDFTIGKDMNNEIAFYIDYSKINLVWMILDTLSDEVQSKSSQVSMDLTNVLLTKLEDTRKEVSSDKALVIKLIDGSGKESADVSAMQSSLQGLNLNMDLDNFPVKAVVNRTDLVKKLSADIAKTTNDYMLDLRKQLRKMNVTVADIDKVIVILDGTKSKLDNMTKRMNSNTSDLASLASTLQESISSVKSQIDAAGSVRRDILVKLSDLKNLLESDLATIMSIQSSFNKIESNIQGIQVKNAESIVSPIKTTINPVTSKKTHLNYIFPSLIVLVVMFVSLLLSSTLVVMEKSSKAYFRNFITPTRDIVFIVATYLTSLLLLFVQVVVILIVAAFFFKSQLISSLPNTILTLFIAGTFFILVGMAVGYLFNSEETSTLAAISLGSVFLFLSSVILPLESMPQYVMRIAEFNPFVVSENALRQALLFQYPLRLIGYELLLLLGYSALLFGLTLVIQKVMKKHFVTKYARRFAPVKMKKKE